MKPIRPTCLLILLCAFVVLFLSGCRSGKQPPAVINGTIDLTGWNFETDGTVNLTGQWEFYWQQLLTPGDFKGKGAEINTTYLNLPELWDGNRIDGQELMPEGFGTYRVMIRIAPGGASKALLIRSVLSVCKVWVNGELVAASGVPGTSESSEKPEQMILLPHFSVSGEQAEIIIQNSNFHNVQGGLSSPIIFGNENQILQSVRTRWAVTGILGGMFLAIGLFHIVLFLQHRSEKANLYFGLYCLVWAIGSVFGDTGGSLAQILFPTLPWRLSIDLTLLSYGLVPPLILLFYHALFPRYKSKLVEWFYLALGGAFVAYLLATPPNAYGAVVRLYILSTLGVILYLLIKYTVDIVKKEKGARLLIPGYLALTASFLNDKLYDLHIIDTATLMPLGSALFFLSYSFLISYRFSETYKKVAKLSKELEGKNIELQTSLKSAQEIIELKSQLEEQRHKKERASIEAEKSILEKLRYQLNPHFLFNALTSIRGAILKDAEIAREMVANLSEFCRLTLTGGKEEWLEIKKELQLVQHYLKIEQIRLGDYLTVSTEVDPALEEREIPSFLLQPLVENAVKFGKLTSPDHLEIRIRIQSREDRVYIEVANTGSWVEIAEKDEMKSTGIGLENL